MLTTNLSLDELISALQALCVQDGVNVPVLAYHKVQDKSYYEDRTISKDVEFVTYYKLQFVKLYI